MENRTNKIICVFILICVFLGNIIKIDSIRILGIIPTLYRVGIPLCSIYYVCKRFYEKNWNLFFKKKLLVSFFSIMLFWILKGCILIFTSEYVILADAVKELLGLVLGTLTVYCLTECLNDNHMTDFFINVLKIFMICICAWAFVEGLFNFHLSTSKYYYENMLMYFWTSMASGEIYPMTASFYGVNDYSAMMSIFFPLFLVCKDSKSKWKNYIMLLIISIVVSINDSNISLLAMLIVSCVWVILTKFDRISSVGPLIILFVNGIGKKWIGNFVKWIKINVYEFVSRIWKITLNNPENMQQSIINSDINFMDVINAQTQNFGNQAGSLYLRTMITYDSLKMILATYFIGVGPAAFSNYLKVNGSSTYLTNPHNFWLEILTQYGAIVFLLYVIFLLYIFIQCLKKFWLKKDKRILIYICIMISYVISSIVPSSFLNYPYHWLIPALGIVLLANKECMIEE